MAGRISCKQGACKLKWFLIYPQGKTWGLDQTAWHFLSLIFFYLNDSLTCSARSTAGLCQTPCGDPASGHIPASLTIRSWAQHDCTAALQRHRLQTQPQGIATHGSEQNPFTHSSSWDQSWRVLNKSKGQACHLYAGLTKAKLSYIPYVLKGLGCLTSTTHPKPPGEDIRGAEGSWQDLLHTPHDPMQASSLGLPPEVQKNPNPTTPNPA